MTDQSKSDAPSNSSAVKLEDVLNYVSGFGDVSSELFKDGVPRYMIDDVKVSSKVLGIMSSVLGYSTNYSGGIQRGYDEAEAHARALAGVMGGVVGGAGGCLLGFGTGFVADGLLSGAVLCAGGRAVGGSVGSQFLVETYDAALDGIHGGDAAGSGVGISTGVNSTDEQGGAGNSVHGNSSDNSSSESIGGTGSSSDSVGVGPGGWAPEYDPWSGLGGGNVSDSGALGGGGNTGGGVESGGVVDLGEMPITADDLSGKEEEECEIDPDRIQECDPLLLDLNRDNKVLVTGFLTSGATYDVDGDGVREPIGWVTGGDGIFAYDADGDGLIQNGNEINFTGYVDGAQSNIQGLKYFDSNADGILDANDTEWPKFKVWLDANSDGVSDSAEVRSLPDVGISSVSLASDGVSYRVGNNAVLGQGQFTWSDGAVGKSADVSFTYLDLNIAENADGSLRFSLGDNSAVDVLGSEAGVAPIQMSDRRVLAILANDAANTIFAADGGSKIFAASGNDTVWGASGDDVISGDKGADDLHGGAGNDILYFDSDDLVVDGGDGIDVALLLSPNGSVLNLTASNVEVSIGNAGADIFSVNAGDSRPVILSGNGGNDTLQGGDGSDLLVGGAGADLLSGGAGLDTVSYGGSSEGVCVNLKEQTCSGGDAQGDILLDIENIVGSACADVLSGDDFDNELLGGAGNDTLFGLVGADTLSGGSGTDRLEGGSGNDVYVFGRGDGATTIYDNCSGTESYQETVTDYVPGFIINQDLGDDLVAVGSHVETQTRVVQSDGGNDELSLGAGIACDQLWFEKSSNDLLVSIIGANDEICIKDWYVSDYNKIETISLSSVTEVLDHASVVILVSAMAAMAPPVAGQLTLTGEQHQQLDNVIAASWR
ncbi:MAG: calcium-binding protein [Rhodospirillaceae bacterium]|nr:calcium-binding protein [Rhodospirillaceae bacterium]